jgi:hypothetical protein
LPTCVAGYADKAEECLVAAEKIADPAERAAMVKIAACYMLLAERQDHSTAHREEDRPEVAAQTRAGESVR